MDRTDDGGLAPVAASELAPARLPAPGTKKKAVERLGGVPETWCEAATTGSFSGGRWL